MEVTDVPLVGRAAVALRDFELAEVVMNEDPLLVLPKTREAFVF